MLTLKKNAKSVKINVCLKVSELISVLFGSGHELLSAAFVLAAKIKASDLSSSSFVDDGYVVKVNDMIECLCVVRNVGAFSTFHCVSDVFFPF